jgi:YidC/Oxa1 family membrane protein insertase
MDVSMPLMSVFFSFAVPAVIGVYWMFKSVLSTIQQAVLAKVMPLPTFTEEDYKAAEKELGVKNKKNTEKKERDPNAPRPRSLHHIDDEDYNEKGELKPATKAPEVKASETPVGAAPLKNDEPERKAKKDKKSEKDAAEAENAEEKNEENK